MQPDGLVALLELARHTLLPHVRGHSALPIPPPFALNTSARLFMHD
jgi:hypothetical protein